MASKTQLADVARRRCTRTVLPRPTQRPTAARTSHPPTPSAHVRRTSGDAAPHRPCKTMPI
eukprot:5567801-Prymnesium_polylepis.1